MTPVNPDVSRPLTVFLPAPGTGSTWVWPAEPWRFQGWTDSSREAAARPRREQPVRRSRQQTQIYASPRPSRCDRTNPGWTAVSQPPLEGSTLPRWGTRISSSRRSPPLRSSTDSSVTSWGIDGWQRSRPAARSTRMDFGPASRQERAAPTAAPPPLRPGPRRRDR